MMEAMLGIGRRADGENVEDVKKQLPDPKLVIEEIRRFLQGRRRREKDQQEEETREAEEQQRQRHEEGGKRSRTGAKDSGKKVRVGK